MLTARFDTGPGRACAGFSLTELMAASALGLFLVGGIAFMLLETAKASRQALLEAQLRQAMATAVTVVGGELRRAGYWSGAGGTAGAPLYNGHAPLQLVGDDCLLFGYDQENGSADGTPADGDRLGLRLVNGTLQIRTSSPACATPCTGCTGGNWFAVTDPQTVTITDLGFRENFRSLELDGHAHATVVREIGVTLAGGLRRDPGIRHRTHVMVAIRNDEIL